MKSPLRTIFKALARPGIHMPHDGRTPQLLLCGAKPIGFLENHEEQYKETLEKAVAKGQLLRHEFSRQSMASVCIYQKPGISPELPTIENLQTDAPIFALPLTDKAKEDMQNSYIDYSSILARLARNEIDSVAINQKWIEHGWSADFIQAIKQKAMEGALIKFQHEFMQTWPSLTIYGQLDQLENIKRLVEEIRKYDKAPDAPQDRELEGRLPGYSDNDISLNARDNSWVMNKTEPLRRYCRHQLMLDAGPQWDRNF
tara:strand:- start:1061 stop:1831 length:771 start_codon:yes stop_codon:yes gene_type:complete